MIFFLWLFTRRRWALRMGWAMLGVLIASGGGLWVWVGVLVVLYALSGASRYGRRAKNLRPRG